MRNSLLYALFGFYGFTAICFLLDQHTLLEIRTPLFKTFIYYFVFILTPVLLIGGLFYFRKSQRRIFLLIPFAVLVSIIITGPLKAWKMQTPWLTQTVIWEEINNNKTVEFQIRDNGAFGYNRRTVQVKPIGPFMLLSRPQANISSDSAWKRVDKEVNEAGLNY